MDSFLNTLSQEKIAALARSHLREKSLILASEGIKVRPWHHPDIPLFHSLTLEKQRDVVSNLESQLELLRSAKIEGLSLLNSKSLLARAVKLLGGTPTPDIYELIHDDDTIELYSPDQRQLFRSLQYFRYVSFTLEQIHSRTWFELTTRDAEIEKTLGTYVEKIFTGEISETVNLEHLAAHLAEEIDSEESKKFWIQMRFLSPVMKDGKVSGLIAVNRTRAA